MFDILKNLCNLYGTSGNEEQIRDYIISEIKDFCEYKVDALGNVLFEKKGNKEPKHRVMLDAHMDEVGFIVTAVTKDGFLKFSPVGGINTEALFLKSVIINGKVHGVVGGKPFHLCEKGEAEKLPDKNALYIDIGALNEKDARTVVNEGDFGVFKSEYLEQNGKILSKALDDRVGCAVMIKLIKEESEYGFCGSFSVMEEIGCIGAGTAAFSLCPEYAIVLEGTTAADIADVSAEKQVCNLGKGVAVSFMDGGTVYDRNLFKTALESGLNCQKKRATTGGNDAASIHKSRTGVKTMGLSVPCRYIHSSSCVCDKNDIESMFSLAKYMIEKVQNDD